MATAVGDFDELQLSLDPDVAGFRPLRRLLRTLLCYNSVTYIVPYSLIDVLGTFDV